jgi:hypothetical protein
MRMSMLLDFGTCMSVLMIILDFGTYMYDRAQQIPK